MKGRRKGLESQAEAFGSESLKYFCLLLGQKSVQSTLVKGFEASGLRYSQDARSAGRR